MGFAAREKAATHGYERFLSDWISVVNATVRLKDGRTRLEHAHLDVHELSVSTAGIRRRRHTSLPGVFNPGTELRFEGRLTVRGRSNAARIADATVTLSAVHESTSQVVDVPLVARQVGDGFHLQATAPLGALYPSRKDTAGRTHLRLRVVWNNSSWETVVRRSPDTSRGRSVIEVSFDRDEGLVLLRN
jgi:hypothetical protein